MFFQTRETMLESLRRMGSACCGYDIDGSWPKNRCDCKFGAGAFKKNGGGEQTGCPELRSVYEVIEAMGEADWDRAILAGGGVCIEYLNDPPRSDEAAAAARRIDAADQELARILAALHGAPRPLVEAVLLAQGRERQLALRVLGMRDDDGSEPASIRISPWGLQVIAACRGLLPDADNDGKVAGRSGRREAVDR